MITTVLEAARAKVVRTARDINVTDVAKLIGEPILYFGNTQSGRGDIRHTRRGILGGCHRKDGLSLSIDAVFEIVDGHWESRPADEITISGHAQVEFMPDGGLIIHGGSNYGGRAIIGTKMVAL